jgi:hypothetical protein
MTFGALDLVKRTHLAGQGLSRSCHFPQDLHILSGINPTPNANPNSWHLGIPDEPTGPNKTAVVSSEIASALA